MVGPINVTVGGRVGITRSIMTASNLDELKARYNNADDVVLRIPVDNEVACSYSRALDEVCLFEHMLIWGMCLVNGEWPSAFKYLVRILAHYHLLPGQLTANGIATILGFWAFMYTCQGKDMPILEAPFPWFFELKERHKEGRYHFARRIRIK